MLTGISGSNTFESASTIARLERGALLRVVDDAGSLQGPRLQVRTTRRRC